MTSLEEGHDPSFEQLEFPSLNDTLCQVFNKWTDR